MRASCLAAVQKGVVDLVRADLPQPGDDEVLVKTDFSYLSPGTEKWIIRGLYNPEGDEIAFPRLLGYQAVGRIVSAGPGVTLKPGQRVFARCGRWAGILPLYGAHSSHLVCSEEDLIVIVPPDARYAGCSAGVVAQVGYNAGTCMPLPPGARVWLIGEGIIGQFTLQTLLSRGAEVLVSGLDAFRLRIAEKCGATATMDAGAGGEEEIREFAGEGLDAVVDTVGVPALVDLWLDVLRRGGAFVHVASNPAGYNIDLRKIKQPKEITVYNPDGTTPERMLEALRLVTEGALDVLSVTTHTVPPEGVASLYSQLLAGEGEILGVMVDWRKCRG